MIDGDAPAAAGDAEARRQCGQELPGLVPERGRLPAAQSDDLPPLQGPAVVVAPNAGDRPLANQGHHVVGVRAVADQVAGAEDRRHVELIEVPQGRLQGAMVRVNVRDQSESHYG